MFRGKIRCFDYLCAEDSLASAHSQQCYGSKSYFGGNKTPDIFRSVLNSINRGHHCVYLKNNKIHYWQRNDAGKEY